mmetsp:Transcript_44504/g.141796  ORF Transcript_44504/g.141796 Transcript_44504/m.141796 type:complete len:507 (+) Transcript_44504:215-1735(+)
MFHPTRQAGGAGAALAAEAVLVQGVHDRAAHAEVLQALAAHADKHEAMEDYKYGRHHDQNLVTAAQLVPSSLLAVPLVDLLYFLLQRLHVRVVLPLLSELLAVLLHALRHGLDHDQTATELTHSDEGHEGAGEEAVEGLLPGPEAALEGAREHRGHDAHEEHRRGAQQHLGEAHTHDAAEDAHGPVRATDQHGQLPKAASWCLQDLLAGAHGHGGHAHGALHLHGAARGVADEVLPGARSELQEEGEHDADGAAAREAHGQALGLLAVHQAHEEVHRAAGNGWEEEHDEADEEDYHVELHEVHADQRHVVHPGEEDVSDLGEGNVEEEKHLPQQAHLSQDAHPVPLLQGREQRSRPILRFAALALRATAPLPKGLQHHKCRDEAASHSHGSHPVGVLGRYEHAHQLGLPGLLLDGVHVELHVRPDHEQKEDDEAGRQDRLRQVGDDAREAHAGVHGHDHDAYGHQKLLQRHLLLRVVPKLQLHAGEDDEHEHGRCAEKGQHRGGPD